MQIELEMDKVTPHGMPHEGGYIEEIHLNATCKVYVVSALQCGRRSNSTGL
jgi:hypothetical protein